MFYRRFGKRVFDIVLAVLALTILSPVLCLIAALVKLTSRGPVLYVQERIGKDSVPFRFIKFRTMVVGAENRGPAFCALRTTRELRRWDESFAGTVSTSCRSSSTSCAAT